MALNRRAPLRSFKGSDFHLYHAKSTCESLLVHSLSVFSLVHAVLPFTQVYSDADKEVMRWRLAARLRENPAELAKGRRVLTE